jgi:serine/threonine protein kinase
MSETSGQDGLNDLPARTPEGEPLAASLEGADNLGPASALFGHTLPDPTDDAPTVISKVAPRAASTEEVLAGMLSGRTLAQFELLEPVGVGGMAAVLRARDTQLDRIVALKILPPDMAADAENVRRFHQEARSAAKLDHENIARVFFCGEDQNLHFIAFEFVEGDTLRAVIERQGRLPVAEAVHYMLQVATGLAHAAARGVVHRDIKPSNIIITPNGRAKLVDMGLARTLGPHHDGGLTQSGVTLGTFDYISPEQAIEPRDADVRSDIYSLGCTFYHALTGQPPVPEGTAAKKLHHHQQVAPVDPRQINPDISDEVAAILARTMAKDAKARYQRPEHLVQHLLAAAQRLGATSELPEGVLYVDAALPEPPRIRPMLLAAFGVLAVVVLVLLFGSSTWTTTGTNLPGDTPFAKPKDAGTNGPGPSVTQNQPNPNDGKNSPPVKQRYVARDFDAPTTKELAEAVLANPDAEEFNFALGGDLWLIGDDSADAAFALLVPGRKLTLRAIDAGKPPTLWIPYDPRHRPSPRWTGLLLGGDEVTLRDLRIVIDAKVSSARMAGVVLQGGRNNVFNCEFVQYQPSFSDSERFTSLLVDGTHSALKPSVTLEGCVFLGPYDFPTPVPDGEERRAKPTPEELAKDVAKGGQDAVTVAGPANVKAENCAFGPHASLFMFEAGGQTTGRTAIHHCTAIASSGDWSAFRFADGAACDFLEVKHCLFARPDAVEPAASGMMDARRAVLLRQAGLARIRYEGLGNRYYHLDAFWARSGDELSATTVEGFQTEASRQGGKESSGRLLGASPWFLDRPLDPLQQSLAAGNLRDTFKLKDGIRELREVDKPGTMVGVERALWGPSYDKLPDLDPVKPALARKPLVVDPTAKPSDGVFKKLSTALDEANPGDIILIKVNGELKVPLVRLEKASVDVTIKPFPDHHPILVLDETSEPDAALFTLNDGKLALDGLEIRLQPPNRSGFKAQAVVKIAQDGACSFNRCVITLSNPRNADLAVVSLVDPAGVMKMDKPEARLARSGVSAHVIFQDSFVRGEGELVWVRSSRPFDLDCGNSLIALTGSLLNVEAARDDAGPTPTGQTANIRLSRLTAYLGGYLVRLKAGRDLKSLVPVHCKPITDCLFVAADKKTTLIHLDGPSANEDRMHSLLQWDGGKNNIYSGFDHMLDQQPPENSMEMSDPPYGQKEWKVFTGESDGRFTSVKFVEPPDFDKLAQTTPASFKLLDADPPLVGVEINDLPRPGISDDSRLDSE